jgi:hypothetical protein
VFDPLVRSVAVQLWEKIHSYLPNADIQLITSQTTFKNQFYNHMTRSYIATAGVQMDWIKNVLAQAQAEGDARLWSLVTDECDDIAATKDRIRNKERYWDALVGLCRRTLTTPIRPPLVSATPVPMLKMLDEAGITYVARNAFYILESAANYIDPTQHFEYLKFLHTGQPVHLENKELNADNACFNDKVKLLLDDAITYFKNGKTAMVGMIVNRLVQAVGHRHATAKLVHDYVSRFMECTTIVIDGKCRAISAQLVQQDKTVALTYCHVGTQVVDVYRSRSLTTPNHVASRS